MHVKPQTKCDAVVVDDEQSENDWFQAIKFMISLASWGNTIDLACGHLQVNKVASSRGFVFFSAASKSLALALMHSFYTYFGKNWDARARTQKKQIRRWEDLI